MIKERIQEVFEFTKSESPYRKANKGWINQDIFLDLSPSEDTFKQTNEVAKVTLFWSPINNLLSNIFLISILCSLLVFASVSFSKGRFELHLVDNISIIDTLKDEENRDLNIINSDDKDTVDTNFNQDFDIKYSDEQNLLDYDLKKADQKIIIQKTDKLESLINESQSDKDIKIFKNKKQKSNFI